MKYKSNHNVVYSCKYHVVWCPKYRRSILKDGIHKAIKLIKGRSSRVLRQEYPPLKTKLPTLWSNSYFVSTVGGASLSDVKQYIESQKEPIKKRRRKEDGTSI